MHLLLNIVHLFRKSPFVFLKGLWKIDLVVELTLHEFQLHQHITNLEQFGADALLLTCIFIGIVLDNILDNLGVDKVCLRWETLDEESN